MKLNAAVVIRASVAIVLLMLAGLLAWPGENAGAGGLDIVVNTPHDLTTDVCDETHCSLREAIMLANSNPEPDTITFDPEVFPPDDETDLVPFSSLPKIDASAGITIDGTGASVTIVGYEVNDSADAALYIRSNPGVDARDVVIKNIKMAYWPHRAILICAGEVPPVPPQDDPVCGYNLENVSLENISTPDEQVNLETGIVVEGANLSGIDFENVSVGPAYFEGIIILGANDVSDVTVRSGVIDVGDFAVIVEAGNVLTNARVEDVTAMGDRAIIVDSQTANNVVVEGNTAEGGIFFAGMGANNVIRENEAFAAFDRDGILVGSGRVTISRNSIHGNDKLGINLFSMSDPANGVTPNDGGDVDSGPNGLLNFPVLTGSTSQLVSGTACGECLVELFVSDNDASGYGEGMTFLRDGNADASGDFAVSICGLGLAAGTKVTATATDSGGNTSEFSLNYTLTESSGGCPATPSPSPTPTPTPTPIPTPTPTGQTPTPTPTGQAATPTPTPTSTPAPSDLTQGDNDCDGDSDAVDALKTLQDIAAIDYSQEPGCPEIGGAVPAGGEAQRFGDIDCDGDVDAVDALQILRNVAGLPLNQGEGCPAIGDEL